jgi:hypothetical protein
MALPLYLLVSTVASEPWPGGRPLRTHKRCACAQQPLSTHWLCVLWRRSPLPSLFKLAHSVCTDCAVECSELAAVPPVVSCVYFDSAAMRCTAVAVGRGELFNKSNVSLHTQFFYFITHISKHASTHTLSAYCDHVALYLYTVIAL